MDVFPNKFELSIRCINYEGKIDSVFYKDLNHYLIIEGKKSKVRFSLPEETDFRRINIDLKGKLIRKRKGSYNVNIMNESGDSVLFKLKYPYRTLFYSLPIEEYEGVLY